MKKKLNTLFKKILIWVVIPVLVSVLAAMIYAFVSTPAPILYLSVPSFINWKCYPNEMDLSKGYDYSFQVSNRAETEVMSQICLSGENITFSVDDIKQNNIYCYNPNKIPPKSSDLVISYSPKLYFNDNNITLKTTVSCVYNLFGISRPCDSLIITCNFKKNWNNNYQIVQK